VADMDDFDLDRSTRDAWSEFEARLAEVISVVDDSGDLTIGTESGSTGPGPFVRFSSPQRDRVRAEAAADPDLAADLRLDPDQAAAMAALGWHPPAADGSGCPRFWLEDDQDRPERLAASAVGALRDVYGVPHPVFLAPDQLGEVLRGLTPVESAGGGLVPAEPAPGSARRRLEALVDAELTELYGYPPLRDAEGDVAIRVGSTMLFLRTAPDGQEVLVFSAVVHDVAGRSRATEVLNDLNVAARWVKFQLVRDRVFVTLSVLARPFVPEHLRQAVRILSDVADGIDEELAAKLYGRTTFSEPEGA